MDKITVNFTQEKETPGALRYQEVDRKGKVKKIADGAVVGTLYLRKSALGGASPENITVVITNGKDKD